MLQEIEVPPGLFGGVVHRAIGCLAAGQGTRAPLLKSFHVDPFPLGVKVVGGKRRAIDGKSGLEEMSVAHAGTRVVIDHASHFAAVSCAP